MNNYQNYKCYDNIPDNFCALCALLIEDLVTVAEGTEYETKLCVCEKCYEKNNNTDELQSQQEII
jgi:hypothetical protein